MNRIVSLMLIARGAVATGVAVRVGSKHRQAADAAALRCDIERFENEGGLVSTI